jgi:hypothetical protein
MCMCTGGNMSEKNRKAMLEQELGLKRHDRWIYLIGIIFIIIMVVLLCIEIFLNDQSPITKGLQPHEVVELFYMSVNTLDTYTITHIIDGGNINQFYNRIVMNTMTGMVSHMYDITHIHPLAGSDYIVYNPAEWIEKGQPDLSSGEKIMGILNLKIRKIKKYQFEATYDYYITGITEDMGISGPFVLRCVDMCTLEQRKGSWFIVDIEQVSETGISVEESAGMWEHKK